MSARQTAGGRDSNHGRSLRSFPESLLVCVSPLTRDRQPLWNLSLVVGIGSKPASNHGSLTTMRDVEPSDVPELYLNGKAKTSTTSIVGKHSRRSPWDDFVGSPRGGLEGRRLRAGGRPSGRPRRALLDAFEVGAARSAKGRVARGARLTEPLLLLLFRFLGRSVQLRRDHTRRFDREVQYDQSYDNNHDFIDRIERRELNSSPSH